MANTIKVLYFAFTDASMHRLVHHRMPEAVELVALEEGTDAERLQKIADADAVLLAGRKLDEVFLDAAPRLKLVVFHGVGYHDYVDVESLRRRGIALAISPAGTGPGVAEHAIMLMLAVGKRLPFLDRKLREGTWLAQNLRAESRGIAGGTIGIVGLGRIGREVARRLAGWGAKLVYHDIAAIPAEVERALGITRLPLEELLRHSDIVTLHVPLTPATRGMIDGTALALMPPGAILINCARGPVVDEAALVEALRSGHLGGAGLDVFAHEPPPFPSAFAEFRNVVLTPHNGAGTADIMRMKMEEIWRDVALFFAGREMVNTVLSAEATAARAANVSLQTGPGRSVPRG